MSQRNIMPYLGSSCTSFELPDLEDEDTVIPQNAGHCPNFATSHPIIADLCIVK